MAELLVRVVDKIGADVYQTARLTKRGDVIAVQADGWSWGLQELANPDWRILRVPGVNPDDLSGLLVPEPEIDPQHPSKVLQARAFKLDVDHAAVAGAGLATFFGPTNVVAPVAKLGTTLEDVQIVEEVQSNLETVSVTDGNLETSIEVVVNVKQSYAVVDLGAETIDKLSGLTGVTKCGPVLREQCHVEVSPALVTLITTSKPVLKDPGIIGVSPAII